MSTPAADVQFERGEAYVAVFPQKCIQARTFGNLNAQTTASLKPVRKGSQVGSGQAHQTAHSIKWEAGSQHMSDPTGR